ncbi:phosphatidylglycerophosphatase A [Fructilactobacillus florum]|uniref:phosphatidylglycerophosphatase A family protein n=1 Tax=Fructilactobacillus florum TaxID=640331 RepID=UPI00028EE668|nr:phosphatidylglycerophosphatase A [Fructilactobacillus florum]EKK21042.1 low temperature requirement C protein (putative) [Fructilactobacillus florum 2F]
MNKSSYPYTTAYQNIISQLAKKHITIADIASLAQELQHQYSPVPAFATIKTMVIELLHQPEVLNRMLVGFALDKAATQHELQEPLQAISAHDLGVFGTDETLALGIATWYGTIGMTNFNELDLYKHGILHNLDHNQHYVNTFTDDLVAGVAAAVAAKIAHQQS